MKSNFEERKENRLTAYQNLAEKNENLSVSSWEQSNKLADMIPFGQPILVGHHSEKSHRSHIKKIHNAMDKSVQADKKAKYYAGRVESLLSNTAVSSDDPNAIDKLAAKLERLEGLQELMKDANKIVKNAKITEVQKVASLMGMGFSEDRALKLLQPDFCGRIGFASYSITNNGATIRSTKQRIEYLGKIQAIENSEEVINGITLKVSSEDNRVQIFFPSIPEEAVRKELKQNGFHWSHNVGAWMRNISEYAIYLAKEIITKYYH